MRKQPDSQPPIAPVEQEATIETRAEKLDIEQLVKQYHFDQAIDVFVVDQALRDFRHTYQDVNSLSDTQQAALEKVTQRIQQIEGLYAYKKPKVIAWFDDAAGEPANRIDAFIREVFQAGDAEVYPEMESALQRFNTAYSAYKDGTLSTYGFKAECNLIYREIEDIDSEKTEAIKKVQGALYSRDFIKDFAHVIDGNYSSSNPRNVALVGAHSETISGALQHFFKDDDTVDRLADPFYIPDLRSSPVETAEQREQYTAVNIPELNARLAVEQFDNLLGDSVNWPTDGEWKHSYIVTQTQYTEQTFHEFGRKRAAAWLTEFKRTRKNKVDEVVQNMFTLIDKPIPDTLQESLNRFNDCADAFVAGTLCTYAMKEEAASFTDVLKDAIQAASTELESANYADNATAFVEQFEQFQRADQPHLSLHSLSEAVQRDLRNPILIENINNKINRRERRNTREDLNLTDEYTQYLLKYLSDLYADHDQQESADAEVHERRDLTAEQKTQLQGFLDTVLEIESGYAFAESKDRIKESILRVEGDFDNPIDKSIQDLCEKLNIELTPDISQALQRYDQSLFAYQQKKLDTYSFSMEYRKVIDMVKEKFHDQLNQSPAPRDLRRFLRSANNTIALMDEHINAVSDKALSTIPNPPVL